MDLDSVEINQTINAGIERSLFGSAIAFVLMYAILAVVHLSSLRGDAGVIMSGIAAGSSLLIAAIAILRKFQRSASAVQTDLGLIALVIIFNCAAHLFLEPQPANTLNFAMLIIGVSFLFVSYRWYYFLVGLSVSLWSLLVVYHGLQSELGQWGWFLFFAAVFSAAFHHHRGSAALSLLRLNATHKRYAQALNELVQATEPSEDSQTEMFVKIANTLAKNLYVSSVGIWTYSKEKECIECVEFVNSASGLELKGHSIRKPDAPKYFDALLSNRVISVDDVMADSRTQELHNYLEENSISSMLDAPITVRGEMWGVICIEHRGPKRVWDVHEQAFAASAADVAAISVQNTHNAMLEKRSRQTKQLESLGILAGGVAHDFNNLLTVVIGQSELVQRSSQERKTQKSVEAVLEASQRAKALAQQMLAYSGRATFLGKYHCLSKILKEFDASWGYDLVTGAELSFADGEEELIVNMDATQIRQVITNLLTNARDSGAKTIKVSSGKVLGREINQSDFFVHDIKSDSLYAWLEVSDDGVGMSARVKSNIFDPFFTTRQDGTGLGLAAVLGILKAHQGTIDVESSEGNGSRFRLFLPLEANASVEDCDGPTPELNKLPVEKQEKVLLVEDEELVRELAETLLLTKFDDVVSFGGVKDALSSIESMESPELSAALVDLSLGDGDGIQVIEELERRFPSLPIVLMSGYDAHDILSKLPKTSDVQFLHKPFTQADLLQALQSAQSKSAHLH